MPTLNSGILKTYCECPVEGTGGAPESMYSKEELPGRVHDPGQPNGWRGALVVVANEDFKADLESFQEWYRGSGLLRRAGL